MTEKPDQIPQVDLRMHHQRIREEIMSAVGATLAGAQFVLGTSVRELEEKLAPLVGCTHAVGVNSGTDALVLALAALEIGPGDEVITTPFTFVSTVEMIAELGARPVLVDVEPDTFNLDPHGVERAVTSRTRAILPVHLYGQSADLERLTALARAKGIALVEDAAQALGALHHGRPVCSWGNAGCLSFYPTKNLGACGDGGMAVTRDDGLADKLRLMRTHGSRSKYEYLIRGRNSRLDALQAAILLVKLRYLSQWNEERRSHARTYAELLADLPVVLPVERPENVHVYHQYTIRVRRRDELRRHLDRQGVKTAVHYPLCLHLQPAFRDLGYGEGAFPAAEKASREVLSLPMYPELSRGQLERIAAALTQGAGTLGLDGEGPPS